MRRGIYTVDGLDASHNKFIFNKQEDRKTCVPIKGSGFRQQLLNLPNGKDFSSDRSGNRVRLLFFQMD